MRAALARVREELGPDAVILASTRCRDGVEVSAAVDREYEAISNAARLETSELAGGSPRVGLPPPAALAPPAAEVSSVVRPADPPVASAVVVPPPGGNVDDALGSELRTLRRVLETQLASLTWNEHSRRKPQSAQLLRELTEVGFARDLVAATIETIPESLPLERARALAVTRLADRLEVSGDRWAVHGGTVAFIGVTGAGKTTALMRLATLWTMRHGSGSLAIISTDGDTYGAHERLQRLGRLLAAPTYTLDDAADLPALLMRLSESRLVLMDTAGFTDQAAGAQPIVSALQQALPRAELALCLPASTQAAALQRTVRHCAGLGRVHGVLTRLDECVSLGGALSAILQAGLPLAWSSQGRSCTEGLTPARSLEMVTLAMQLAQQHGASADEDLLARRFGGENASA